MKNKLKVKRESWFYALISACCGLVLCFLAGCFFIWLGKMIYLDYGRSFWTRYAEEQSINVDELFHRGMGMSLDDFLYNILYSDKIDQIRFLVCQFFFNTSLILMGISIVRFHGSINKLKGKMMFLIIPLLWESLTIIAINQWKYGPLPIILWGAMVVCIIVSVLVGLCIRIYKIRTYVICCVMAVMLSVPCTLIMIREIYYGSCSTEDMIVLTCVLQPFAVFFPIISLIKGIIFTSETGDVINQNDTKSLSGSAVNMQTRCPFCGKEQEAGGKFCFQCGRELSAEPSKESSGDRHCPYCGAKIEDGMLFCKECGTKI